MRYTESDLRTLLDEHVRERAGREPAAPLDAIVRRGRRMRRTRRAVTAGATVACAVAAVALGNTLLTGQPRADRMTAAAQPTDSARPAEPAQPTHWPKLPDRFPVVLGAEKADLRPIYAGRFKTVGAGQTLTFTPTSYFTGIKVACDDPRAWVVVEMPLKGGEMGGTAGRCSDSVGGHHDRKSAPSGWLKRPQSVRIWVFPWDAPVRAVACQQISDKCDESVQGRALLRPEVRDRLSAMVGERPGRWTAAVYDRPDRATFVPESERPADADSPFEIVSTPAG